MYVVCQPQGHASSWQDHLTLSHSGPGSSAGAGGSSGAATDATAARDALEPSEVARIFEGRLAETLLDDDGSLSLSTLASNTFSTLLPKMETQGQLGRAR